MFNNSPQLAARLALLIAVALVWTPVSGVDVASGSTKINFDSAAFTEDLAVSFGGDEGARGDEAGHSSDDDEQSIQTALERLLQRASQQDSIGLQEDRSMLFGVYPGGGNGEIGSVPAPDFDSVITRLNELRGDNAFDIHLYTAWSWHDDETLDHDIERYTSEGFLVTLTIKYSPPPGREGDVDSFSQFVRHIVERHAANPNVHQFVIGNEVNVAQGNPDSSDGPFDGVREATVDGVRTAAAVLQQQESEAQVGFSVAVLERDTDIRFLRELADLGGPDFVNSVGFLGLHVYPGLWPVGSGDGYADMVEHLRNTRAGLNEAGFGETVDIVVLENGYPTPEADLQRDKLDAFVRAVCDADPSIGVSTYSWFDLWDADSGSDNRFAHYGLLRSDMTKKPAFNTYQEFIVSGCE